MWVPNRFEEGNIITPKKEADRLNKNVITKEQDPYSARPGTL